jgi:SWI/SNF-related matrix-associated actin-dependent regulator of chromatin subfamily A-like protein 1
VKARKSESAKTKPPVEWHGSTGPARIEVTRGGFVVYVPADPAVAAALTEMGGQVEEHPQHGWRWSLTTGPRVLELLPGFLKRFDIAAGSVVSQTIAERQEAYAEDFERSSADDSDLPEIPALRATLSPYQRAGVAYAIEKQRTFIADAMGLGKTLMALTTIEALDAYPAVVVCPASLKLNWRKEAKQWLHGRSVQVIEGGERTIYRAQIIIVNYDILHRHRAPLTTWAAKYGGIQAVICDESHYLKEKTARRTKAAAALVKGVPIRLLLSGTPAKARPIELATQLYILDRLDDLGGYDQFVQRYCAPQKTPYGIDLRGSSNREELFRYLRMIGFVRRTKDQVMKDLPPKRWAMLPVELTNEGDYRAAERDIITWLKEQVRKDEAFFASISHLSPNARERRIAIEQRRVEFKARRAEHLLRLNALKQLVAHGKLAAAISWIRDFLDGTDEKLIVFAHHRAIQEALLEPFRADGAAFIASGMDSQELERGKERFQSDPDCRLIVCSLGAGGVGHTLTAATNVAFVEFPWSPSDVDQAEDRAHRRGQTARNVDEDGSYYSVTIWNFVAEGTIDEDILELLESKRAVVEAILDGRAGVEDDDILDELVERLQRR